MRFSDWSSDVCSSDLERPSDFSALTSWGATANWGITGNLSLIASFKNDEAAPSVTQLGAAPLVTPGVTYYDFRSEEHTSELQSLMRSSYDVFCLKKKKITQ